MHRLTKTYQPISTAIRRPEWFDWEYTCGFPYREQLPTIASKYYNPHRRVGGTPARMRTLYGLIHNDFNDGNFTL